MFIWALNTPLNTYYNNFFFWRFHFKVNDFLNVFSTINFSYQYLPEAKAYLEPSRTSTMEFFRDFFFFCKIQKTTPVPESLFNKVTDRSLSSEVATRRCSVKKVFWKYAANLKVNTHAEVQFQ